MSRTGDPPPSGEWGASRCLPAPAAGRPRTTAETPVTRGPHTPQSRPDPRGRDAAPSGAACPAREARAFLRATRPAADGQPHSHAAGVGGTPRGGTWPAANAGKFLLRKRKCSIADLRDAKGAGPRGRFLGERLTPKKNKNVHGNDLTYNLRNWKEKNKLNPEPAEERK